MGTSSSNPEAPPPVGNAPAVAFAYPQSSQSVAAIAAAQQNGGGAQVVAPTLSREQLRTLMRNGLDPDLALNHHQMPRLQAGGSSRGGFFSESSAPSQPQQTVTLRSRFNIRKSTLHIARSSTAGHLYAVRFKFDAEIAVVISVQFIVTETGTGHYQPATAAAAAAGSGKEAEPIYTPRTYSFEAGQNQTFEQPLSLPHALDLSRVSPSQLTAVPSRAFYPLVVTISPATATGTAAASAAAPDASTGVDVKTPALSASASAAGASSSSTGADAGAAAAASDSGSVICQSTFATFVPVNTQTLDVKVLKQQIITANGVGLDLQEIFGLEPKAAAASNANAASATTAKSGATATATTATAAADCVICLTNPRTTTVLPCRHMCLCSECSAVLRSQENARCPVCRSMVESLLHLNFTVSGATQSAVVNVK